MNPADIANKQFTTVRLREGYDQKEVDDFLDQVEEAYTVLLRRAENAEHRAIVAQTQLQSANTQVLPALPFQPPPTPEAAPAPPMEMSMPSMSSIAALLKNAEKTAEELLAKAKVDAEGEAAKLRVDAATALQAAREEGASLLLKAQQDAATLVAEAQGKKSELERNYAQLTTAYNEVRDKLKAALVAFGEAISG